MLALGLILPILPKLVESFVDNDTATAARIFGLFGTAWALMQFLFSPILGALSDRFGRRPVVLLSNFGLALDYVLMALAPSLVWLFIGRVISGITSASISTAFAYIADVTPPERRAAVFGKIGAAFGAGFILGPAVGGLLGGMDPRLPFWIAAGLSFANTLYGWLILPGVAAAGTPRAVPLEKRQPARRTASAALQPDSRRPVAGEFLRAGRACGAALYLRALRDLPIWLGHDDRRPDAGSGRRLRHGGAGRGRRADRQAPRRAPGAAAGACLRRAGILHLWRGPDRAAVLARHSRDGAVGRGGGGDPGADDAARCTGSAGPVAGRDQQRQQHRPDGGTVSVYADICLFHQRPGAAENAGRAVPAGGGVAGAGAGDRVADAEK